MASGNLIQLLANPQIPNVVGAFDRGQASARQANREKLQDQELRAQITRRNAIAQLAPQLYTAKPEEQSAILAQIAAQDPDAAAKYQQQMGQQQDTTQKRYLDRLGVMASALIAAPDQLKPSMYQSMLPEMRALGVNAPDQYTPEMLPMAQQFVDKMKGQGQQGVQSTVIGQDGQYYTVDRSTGKFTPSGVYASQNMRVLEQEGATPYGVVTGRGQAGQVIPLGGQQGAPAPAQPNAPAQAGAQGTPATVPTQNQVQPTPTSGPVRTPTAGERARDIAQAEADVKLQTAPDIAGATTLATEQAKALAERQAALPGQLADIQRMRGNIQGLLSSPGFATVYGKSRYVSPSMLPGNEGADADVMREQLEAQSFQEAIQRMRGLGALSNAEGQKVGAAYTRATNPRQSEESARTAWQEVLQTLTLAEDRIQRGALTAQPSGTSANQSPNADTAPKAGGDGWSIVEE